MSNIKLFESKKIRSHWDEKQEKWYFSVTDIVAILTESIDPLAYWRKLKERLKKEGNQTVTNCHALKMIASDGKMRTTDVADTEQLLRLIQSIPSPKAEPFKQWLAKTGYERMKEIADPDKDLKGLKTQNLRDHMSEAELIFTALAELSTRQIAETEEAKGLNQNANAGRKGGRIAKNARLALEQKTGKNVITSDNFLPPVKGNKKIGKK